MKPVVRAVSPRVLSFAMLSSASEVEAVQMVGIDPGKEPALSRIDEALIQGSYLNCLNCDAIMIGSGLAELLEVKLGDRVVLTVSQAFTGDLSQELMKVGALFHFDEKAMDEGLVFLPIKTAQTMLNINGVHEIAILFTNPDIAREKPANFWRKYNTDKIELVGWPVLLPQLEAALSLTDFSTFLVGIILFGVVALSIINTLFMGIHERMFEFGVLRAVGTRPGGVAQLIIYESFALSVLSIGIGSLLGLGITGLMNYTGIDYRGIEFAGVTFQSVIYPELAGSQFLVYPFWVLVLTVMVGLYPSVHAARLNPSQAIRRSI